jgi:hypothetical protein
MTVIRVIRVMLGVQETLRRLDELGVTRKEIMNSIGVKDPDTISGWWSGGGITHKNRYNLERLLRKKEEKHQKIGKPPTMREVLESAYCCISFRVFDWSKELKAELRVMQRQAYQRHGPDEYWYKNWDFNDYLYEDSWMWNEPNQWQYELVAKHHPDEEIRELYSKS